LFERETEGREKCRNKNKPQNTRAAPVLSFKRAEQKSQKFRAKFKAPVPRIAKRGKNLKSPADAIGKPRPCAVKDRPPENSLLEEWARGLQRRSKLIV